MNTTQSPTVTPGYPLEWPAGHPRTPRARQISSYKFQIKQELATRQMLDEVRMLGYDRDKPVVLSMNVEFRRDGLPYANRTAPADVGVALYFYRDGKPLVFACDAYDSLRGNIRAIGLTVNAIRAIDRHGVTQATERTLQGFTAIGHKAAPDYAELPWWRVLGFTRAAVEPEAIRNRARALALRYHPDRGGDGEVMAAINAAKDIGLRQGTDFTDEAVRVPEAFAQELRRHQ